jgi:hypothetical protein
LEVVLSKEKQKQTILEGIFSIYSKGLQVPSELKGLETEILQNVALPLFAENMSNVNAMEQQAQQAQMQQMEGGEETLEGEMPQGEMEQEQGLPQEEMIQE